MHDLLPHFERELSALEKEGRAFGDVYGHIAGRLSTSGNLLEDPHVDRLVQSFAFLAARVNKRLDDDFPLFTEALLEVLYPHYLRPFPSCSIARFVADGALAMLTKAEKLPRGTTLQSRPVAGVACQFTTRSDVLLAPLQIVSAGWRATASAPVGTVLPQAATSIFSVEIELTSSQAQWRGLGVDSLRVYLDGDASLVTALRETLARHVLAALYDPNGKGPWLQAPTCAPRPAGFSADDALLEPDPRTQPAYRLLTEYFVFPEKFNFVDLPLPAALAESASRRVTLHYALGAIRSDSDEARLLMTVTKNQLLLGCVPVANLFRQRAEPIRINHSRTDYEVLPEQHAVHRAHRLERERAIRIARERGQAEHEVLPDQRRAHAFEVHAIERVFRVHKTAQGEQIQAFEPFYSLRHEQLATQGAAAGRYWYSTRDSNLAAISPGHEMRIGIVDADFNPAEAQTDTLSINVWATNRDLPSQLSIRQPGGDLFKEGGGLAREIVLMRKPTRTERFERGDGALWRLVSHLSLNHLSLSAGGIDALKELLRLYDLPRERRPGNAIIRDGIKAISFTPSQAWVAGKPFATFVRGTEVQLTVDEQAFVGSGLGLFAQLMDHFFGLYAHINSYVQLKILADPGDRVLIVCPPRTGTGPLL